MGRPAKIKAWNRQSSDTDGCSDYKMNMYWGGESSTKYTNEFYICGDMGRPTFERIIETSTDLNGQSTRVQNTSIPRYIISAIVSSPLLAFLETIDKHDFKEIHFLDTGDVYQIRNIDIDDNGNPLDPVQQVFITFEDGAISKTSDVNYISDDAKLAFWDTTNDGAKNLDAEAEYDAPGDVFNAWQLYFESDGTTPATAGNVIMLVYAVDPNSSPSSTIESLIGIFRGEFGDLFSDSTKWQSTQQIWDYFNIADKVGHTFRTQFDKRAFASVNGYLSNETEERAVNIRFDLSIDNSGQQPTTLSRVYSLRGSFNAYQIQDPSIGTYGVTTLGTANIKNTLNTIQDIKFPAGGGAASSPVTVATLTATTAFSNEYLLDSAPTSEYSYDGSFSTKGGYVGSTFRGANGVADNFVFNLLDVAAPVENVNILNFTTGLDPLLMSIWWNYERRVSTGGFPAMGDITAAGAAQIFLNGVLVTAVAGIVPNPAGFAIFGSQAITLLNTGVNTILLTLPTTTGKEVFTDFEVQIKPLF
jgi:hypothetical protein